MIGSELDFPTQARIAQEKKIPGFAFGATTVDEEIYFNAGGYKVVNDPSSGAVDKDTVFWICSMTKLLAHVRTPAFAIPVFV